MTNYKAKQLCKVQKWSLKEGKKGFVQKKKKRRERRENWREKFESGKVVLIWLN